MGGTKAHEWDVLGSAALCKRLGFETFVPDAMWYVTDGDWRWDPARFPRGGGPIVDYTHQNGMKLGLWVAWTHGGDSSDPEALNIFRHPDWATEALKPDWKAEDINWSTLIDLGFDPARDWAERELDRIVTDNHLDYLKHDYTPIVTQCVQTNHRHHYGTDVSYWSTLGYYHVMDGVKQRNPNLVLEGCSGGGHIKDFGYVKRVHYIVTTDTLSALPDRQSIYDSTFAFPPALLMAYTYENFYNKDADRPLPFFWRSAAMSAWQIDPTHSARIGRRRRSPAPCGPRKFTSHGFVRFFRTSKSTGCRSNRDWCSRRTTTLLLRPHPLRRRKGGGHWRIAGSK